MESQSENETHMQDKDNTVIPFNDDEDDIVEVAGEGNVVAKMTGKKKRRLSSNVWSLFDVPSLGPDRKQRCKYKKYGVEYAYPSAYVTRNLERHIDKCVRRNTRDVSQLLIAREQDSLSLSANKFDPQKFRELLNAAIILHDLPFQFVEYHGFRTVFSYLNADVQLVSKNTCESDILKLFKRGKEWLKNLLSSLPGRICFTLDLWTSITTDGYLSLTAHFIDKNWVLQKKVLNFSFLPPPYNGVNMSEKIYSLLSDWGIENKVFSMTLDNASSNTAFIELLVSQLNIRKSLVCKGKYLHVRCCSHILNLIVQDGLKVINESVEKIRESIKYVRGSQLGKLKFQECVKVTAIDGKRGLMQDVPTMWSSTYLMLDSALYYRQAFCHLGISDSNFRSCPSDSEWENVENICKFLSVFYEITLIFSRSSCPTTNLYFLVFALTYLTLRDKIASDDVFVKSMAAKMFENFKKYWADFSTILAIACILDPSLIYSFGKLLSIKFFFNKIYGLHSAQFEELKENLFSLFDEYANTTTSISTIPSFSESGRACGGSSRCDILFRNEGRDIFKEFDDYESAKSFLIGQKTQLELYLEEPKVDRKAKLDVLIWWKVNQDRFPELAAMARDILTIPLSTVASEAAFSVGGRVLDQYRSSLKPDSIEALICTKNWLCGDKTLSELNLDEIIEDSFDVSVDKP